jgi:hypothetical protein
MRTVAASHWARVRTLVLCVAVLAPLARAGWAALLPVALVSDSSAFDRAAWNIAQGNGYCLAPGRPTAYWPVGGPAVYGLVYLIAGHSYAAVKVANVVIGSLAAAATALLARAWFGYRAGWVTGLLVAVWPSQIEMTTSLFSEAQFNTLVATALVLASVWRGGPIARGLALGALLSAAAYTRPIGLLLPFVLAWCSLAGPSPARRAFRTVAAETVLCCLVMAALIAPWTWRNQRIFGHPVLIQSSAGENLWMGNNPETTGHYQLRPASLMGKDEVESSEMQRRAAMAYIRQDPKAFLLRSLRKAFLLHDRETLGVVWNAKALTERFGPRAVKVLKLGSSVYWWIVLAAALGGAALLAARVGVMRVLGHPAIAVWAYFTAVHSVTTVMDRYHFVSIPMIAALAASFLVTIAQDRSRPPSGQRHDADSVVSASSRRSERVGSLLID